MTRGQTVAVAALVLIAMTLVTLLGTLTARKAVLRAEGADLAGAESILVEADLSELRAHADQFTRGTRVFKSLDQSTRAVALLSGEWSDLPIHDGARLTGRAGEALAGADRSRGNDRLTFGSTTYDIVGRLGVRADSPLAADAVLADDALFGHARERLRIDGRAVVERFRTVFPGRAVEIVDQSTNRRTNVDVVTPFLTAAGGSLVAILVGAAAWLAVRLESRAGRARYRVGYRRRHLIGVAVARIVVVGGTCAGAALVLDHVVGTQLHVDPSPGPWVGGIAAGAVLLVTVGVWRASRRWN